MAENENTIFRQEQNNLGEISKKNRKVLRQARRSTSISGRQFTEQVLEDKREQHRQNLLIAKKEPYFGRLDFQEEDKEAKQEFYIGKFGIDDEESGDLLVTDWRAPVSSLFYAFSGSEDDVYYLSPDGAVEGEIHLKRNIVIREQQLQRVVDSYVKGDDALSGGDEFLLYRLGEHKDHRLRDIVATIQGEQNEIIRYPKNEPVIIQGVAGSGKTTVALHRLAYLLYEYREQMRAERMIIFAPNAMFLDYISQVLPELGVGHIQQTTFTDWALSILGDELKLVDPSIRLKQRFELADTADDDTVRRKGSLLFRQQLADFLDRFEARFSPQNDFIAQEGIVLSKETIRKWLRDDFHSDPFTVKRSRMVGRIKRWIEIEQKKDRGKKGTKGISKKSDAAATDIFEVLARTGTARHL